MQPLWPVPHLCQYQLLASVIQKGHLHIFPSKKMAHTSTCTVGPLDFLDTVSGIGVGGGGGEGGRKTWSVNEFLSLNW